jgi:hypothetical protein
MTTEQPKGTSNPVVIAKAVLEAREMAKAAKKGTGQIPFRAVRPGAILTPDPLIPAIPRRMMERHHAQDAFIDL